MDVTDTDRDVWVQRNSADLIAEFDRSLVPFLRQRDGQLRRRVRAKEVARLVDRVLDPFQELPQLLDPHLSKFIPILAEAYLELLQDHRKSRGLSTRTELLMPMPNAICRLLYAFCKIRGEKVIVRFLNVETRYLELLLFALEGSEKGNAETEEPQHSESWTWHERYVVLLWLSQLFFAPFDLSTISSGDFDDSERPVLPGLEWPAQIPGITLRIIPLALKYLASPGKERDGAKTLLIRLAMRRDMQEVGILKALVHWALHTLRPQAEGPTNTPYFYIGSLSFLAGVLQAAADTSMMNALLSPIYYAVNGVSSDDNPTFAMIKGSALARKMMIKVIRSVTTLALRKAEQTMSDTEMVESSIGYLLEHLADNDTPVRLAASKALSVITLKLEPDMALQVVEAVLESLNRNVLWVKNQSNPSGPRTRDLTSVDPLEWHGLMLTLSHLLYRRSPPPEILADIVQALVLGLAFEKRGISGGSVGTNVRDAACFGIWALARRYSTSELLQVPVKSTAVAEAHPGSASTLQLLATELVVAASLDPAGNIRRGSSAALQELIGRHPDTVVEGISIVQTVDYHSVALRSRAIDEVALNTTKLSPQYGVALMEGLLGWRGTGDMDAVSRRVAAASFGALSAEIARNSTEPLSQITTFADLLAGKINSLQKRQTEERHGLVLSLASVFDTIPNLIGSGGNLNGWKLLPLKKFRTYLDSMLTGFKTSAYRKPELIAEALGKLVVSSYPIIVASFDGGDEATNSESSRGLLPGPTILSADKSALLKESLQMVEDARKHGTPEWDNLTALMLETVDTWLDMHEQEVVSSSAQAGLILLLLCAQTQRNHILQSWCDKVKFSTFTRNKHGDGFFRALSGSYHIIAASLGTTDALDQATAAISHRWTSDIWVETHVAILQSLVGQDMLRLKAPSFISIIREGLDDYTTTARGDIGSHVRLEAIRATKTLWEQIGDEDGSGEPFVSGSIASLLPSMLRLAAEKLDRVRIEAQAAVALLLFPSSASIFRGLSFSSKEYFQHLLTLDRPDAFRKGVADHWPSSDMDCLSTMLSGLVTSADTGNEELVIASRAAVASFCDESPENLSKIVGALLKNLKAHQGQDRVIVPTLELTAYLFHIGTLHRSQDINLRQLCLLTQKAGYKTGNVRKIEACVKVYGGVAAAYQHAGTVDAMPAELMSKRQEGITEARRRLGALLLHPWPHVRALVIDELWGLSSLEEHASECSMASKLLSVDWGRAEKALIKKVVGELGLD
ncbi:tubulin folding cofactor D C terminal-domain-containing protein [Apiospora arundinis]|uniref:Tubulin folding cofactor D C terminal-domain-containing protein n=1 Tax=Apiospora arundinis TaxID=335852 RepID=A0ABR2ISX4_9PEZI